MTTHHQLDVRFSDYGESPFQIWDAAIRLPAGRYLHVLHRMDPWIVSKILASEGLDVRVRYGNSDLPVELFIWRTGDVVAKDRLFAHAGELEPLGSGNVSIDGPSANQHTMSSRPAGEGEEWTLHELTGSSDTRIRALQERTASTLGLGRSFHDRLRDGASAPALAVIPAGRSRLGNITGNGYGLERPAHLHVIERPFAIGILPVTAVDFQLFVEATNHVTGAERFARKMAEQDKAGAVARWKGWKAEGHDAYTWRSPAFTDDPRRPVTLVDWDDANAYCNWLSMQTGHAYRLPTEAEWEYACRAGSEADWYFGNDESKANDHAWFGANSDGRTHPVGEKQPNSFGLHDLHGNVWEWTASRYVHNDMIIRNSYIVRGGCWETRPYFMRAAAFCFRNTKNVNHRIGFRIARDLC